MYCVPKRLIAIQVNPTELLAEQPAQVPTEVQRVIDRARRVVTLEDGRVVRDEVR